MNNLDMPVTTTPAASYTYADGTTCVMKGLKGLTKREQACLIMGVADTGDAELDAIITKGNKQRLAGLAMQSLISHHGTQGTVPISSTVKYINDLLKALEQYDE